MAAFFGLSLRYRKVLSINEKVCAGPVTADDRRALAHDRYHHPDPRVQRKMEVLWLKSHGLSHDDIATYADVSRRSVQRLIDDNYFSRPATIRIPGP